MADPRIEHLRKVPLFSKLSRKHIAFVASRVDEVDIPAGKTLITQGVSNHSLHIVMDGELEVVVDGKHRRIMGPGDFFGEISMFDRRAATATVVATSPLRLLVLSHAQFRDAIKSDPDLSLAVLATMAERWIADL
jgi:CRP-like cAMP-binding protein